MEKNFFMKKNVLQDAHFSPDFELNVHCKSNTSISIRERARIKFKYQFNRVT